MLAEALHDTRRYFEAAAVAQSGLDIAEHYPHLCFLSGDLHSFAAKSHSQLGDSELEAGHYYAAGKALNRAEQWRAASDVFAGAANSFEEAYDHARAIDAQECATVAARCDLAEGLKALKVFRAEGCQDENECLQEQLLEGIREALSKLQASLLRYGHFLVSQLGNISPHDFARMKDAMNEYLQLATAKEYDEFSSTSKTRAYREAEYQHLMGTMYANGYSYTQAFDYFHASIDAFEAMGEKEGQADAMTSLAKLYMRRRQIENARVTAQAVTEMSEGANFKNADFVRQARKMLREINAV